MIGNDYSAVVEGVSWDNAGKYRVVASNSYGDVESTCKLSVTTKPSG